MRQMLHYVRFQTPTANWTTGYDSREEALTTIQLVLNDGPDREILAAEYIGCR